MGPGLWRVLPRFESIHADIAAELVFASSGMMMPFPCAIFLAYNDCAGLTHRFWVEFPSGFTIGCLGRVFAEKFAADRYRRLVAGRWLDALLPAKAVGKAL